MKKLLVVLVAVALLAAVMYLANPALAIKSAYTFSYTTANSATDTTLTVSRTWNHWQVISYDNDCWISVTPYTPGGSTVASAAMLVPAGNQPRQFDGRFTAIAINKTAAGVVTVIGWEDN